MGLREQLAEAEGRAGVRRARRAAPEWCIFATSAGCCSRKYECRRVADVVRVVPASECNVSCAQRVPALRIGAVITAHNEGEEVRKTVESLAASIRDERTDLHIIVVDDGSTDGSCVGLWQDDRTFLALRHEQPLGVGRSRNVGAAAALDYDCNVITFHDAHMRFEPPPSWPHPWGLIEHLARRALQERCILSAATTGLKEGSSRSWLCDLFYNAKDGLQPKYRCAGGRQQPEEEWPLSPCMMGAGYVMSAETARALSGATGALWEDTAGRWGFSEQALSVKAFLMGIPVRFSRDVWLRHLYRKSNPVKGAATENWRNVTRSTAVLLGRTLFEERFRALCEARIGKQAVDEILKGAPEPDVKWAREPSDVFTHLCGKRAVPGQWHPDLEALSENISDLCGVQRILVWRPGEHLVWLRAALPDADIRCLDFDGTRLQTWRPWCKAHKVQLHAVAADRDYSERPQTWGVTFDLVVIAGAVQDRCKAVAERLLAPGGRIVCAPSGLRGQLADEHLKLEDAQADKLVRKAGAAAHRKKENNGSPRRPGGHGEQRKKEDQASASLSPITYHPAPVVTVALLSWKRPENIPPILDALAAQTVPVQVYLWDNAAALGADVLAHPLVKLHVRPSHNLGCFPRWQMLAWAETEYVCTIDDDLCPGPELIERAVDACREKCPDGLVGAFGWNDVDGKSYKDAQHINAPKKDRWVEIVKGRFVLLRRALLERLPVCPPAWGDEDLSSVAPGLRSFSGGGQAKEEPLAFRCDDIYLSMCLGLGCADGEAPHLLPGALRGHWREQGQRGVALAGQRGHYDRRHRAVLHLREWLTARQEA